MLLALAASPMTAEGAGVSERAAPWDPARVVSPAAGQPFPTPQELEARGGVIGEILVKIFDVFDPADPREGSRIYRTANVLHYEIRRYAVEQQLTLRSGEALKAHRPTWTFPAPWILSRESRFQIVVETKRGF